MRALGIATLLVALIRPVAGDAGVADNVLAALVNMGKIDQAREVADVEGGNPVQLVFLEGLIAKRMGDLKSAIELFERTLEADPAYINARRELAHSYYLAGRLDAAEYQFEQLFSIDPNAEMRVGYSNFLAQITNAQPTGASVAVAIVPSTNTNRGSGLQTINTTQGTLSINPESRANDGFGIRVTANAYQRWLLTPQSRVTASATLGATGYDGAASNSADIDFTAVYERVAGNTRWAVGPSLIAIESEDDANDLIAPGVVFRLTRRLGEKHMADATARILQRNYTMDAGRDGTYGTLNFGVRRQVDPTTSVRLGANLEFGRPERSDLQYDGAGITTEVTRAWSGGLQLSAAPFVGWRQFKDDFFLTTTRREDHYLGLGLSARSSAIRFNGFSPGVGCGYTRQHSNIAFYDYDVFECSLSVGRSF